MLIFDYGLNKYINKPDKQFCFEYYPENKNKKREFYKSYKTFASSSKNTLFDRKYCFFKHFRARKRNKKYWKMLAISIVKEHQKTKENSLEEIKNTAHDLKNLTRLGPITDDWGYIWAKTALAKALDSLNVCNCRIDKKKHQNKRSISKRDLGKIYNISLSNLAGCIFTSPRRLCNLDLG